VKGYETLNPDFFEYLERTSELTPPESPLVLEIIEDCLSPEERKTIEEIIRDDCSYNLGIVEKEERRHTRIFLFMLIGLILFGIILWLTKTLAEEPRELLFIPFWFMGETLCDYIFLTGYDLRLNRRLAGRLASIKVVFSKEYEDPHYTVNDVDRLYSDIEKDVNQTREWEA
jgi:predicted nucleic acid-binding Zn ribbon protein